MQSRSASERTKSSVIASDCFEVPLIDLLAEQERERELIAIERNQAWLSQSIRRLAARDLILNGRLAKKAEGGADGAPDHLAHLPPAARAAALALEQVSLVNWLFDCH